MEVAKIGMRAKVDALEAALQSIPQVDCPVRHHFSPGIYAREISIPAGTVITGAIHSMDNLVIVSMGCIRIVSDEGTRDVYAGESLICKAGTKNAGYALQDSRWTNVFPNPSNETDVDVLAEMYTESKACELMGGSKNTQLAQSGVMKKVEA